VLTPTGTAATPTTNIAPKPEDPAMFAAYRAFWDAYLWSASHPNEPRWDQLRAITTSVTFGDQQRDLQQRFARGEVFHIGRELTLNPRIVDRPDDVRVDLFDCIFDDGYWLIEATGEPLPGESTGLHPSHAVARMYNNGGTWIVQNMSGENTACVA
jgi:hypothetical protein